MCEHPNYMLKTGRINPDSGKEVLLFATWSDVNRIKSGEISEEKYYKVPCGVCRLCKIERSKEWASRCVAEASNYEHNYFLTLTYRDDDLPANGSLVKQDLRDFNKKLREYYRRNYNHVGIRLYCSGEYGDQSLRPHYHGCYFNLPINDLTFLKSGANGMCYYTSKTIEKIWEKGYVTIGYVTPSSAAYVARYVAKKQYGVDKYIYDQLKIEPEFSLMSNRPGIGYDFCVENLEKIFKYDKVYLPSEVGKFCNYKIPRYFKKIGERYVPDQVEESKERLQYIGKLINDQVISRTDLSEDEYIFEQNLSKKQQFKTLTQHIL